MGDLKQFSERMLPVNMQAEQAVIGACLLSGIGRMTAIQELEPADFWVDKHAEIFKVITELDAAGEVNVILVDDALKARKAEGIDLEYLFSCTHACLDPDTPDSLVALIKEKSGRRQLWKALMKAKALTEDETKPFNEVQADAEELVFSVRQPPKHTTTPDEWADQFEQEVALTHAGQEGRRRIKTGINEVDKYANCWPGRLTVIAGDTGIGKSVASCKIARESAFRLGQRPYVWLGEMDKQEFWERICAAELKVDYEAVQRRTLPQRDAARVAEWMRTVYKQAPIIVKDTFEDRISTTADIRADARYHAAKHGAIDLVIIDYLLLLGDLNSEVEGSDRRDVRVGKIVWDLINLGKELDAHVFLVHQFNRSPNQYGRQTGRPVKSDLKESSAIEQHAYNIFLLYRPDSDEKLEPEEREKFRGWFEVNIAKARGGKKGNVWLGFKGENQELVSKMPPWPGEPKGLEWPGTQSAQIRADRRKKESGR